MKTNSLFLLLILLGYSLGQAQCGDPDPQTWANPWQSCDPAPNPIPARGNGHWIQYDLGAVYRLSKTHVWNSNAAGKTQTGFRNVVVDFSTDGVVWRELGTYTFPQGSGEAVYGGFEGFDFEGQEVRYVLITALDNWGDATCYGLAEIKFSKWDDSSSPGSNLAEFDLELYPNPAKDYVNLDIHSTRLSQARIQITNVLGQVFYESEPWVRSGDNRFHIVLDDFGPGLYVVSLLNRKTGVRVSKKMVVVKE